MNIILYGMTEDEIELKKIIEHLFPYRKIAISCFTEYESYVKELEKKQYDLVFVNKKGADGLEGITAARTLKTDVPRVWFSDDKDFGPQSFRLGVAFFSQQPLSFEKVKLAFSRCNI